MLHWDDSLRLPTVKLPTHHCGIIVDLRVIEDIRHSQISLFVSFQRWLYFLFLFFLYFSIILHVNRFSRSVGTGHANRGLGRSLPTQPKATLPRRAAEGGEEGLCRIILI